MLWIGIIDPFVFYVILKGLILQPDRVMEFCNNNDLQLIVRAHECVMDGFERFAQGHLITLFSATNYCGMYLPPLTIYAALSSSNDLASHVWLSPLSSGTANNAGAILVLGRDLVVVPKLIHPLPPAISSPETSPERHIEDTWMQVLLTVDFLGSPRILFIILVLIFCFDWFVMWSGIEC